MVTRESLENSAIELGVVSDGGGWKNLVSGAGLQPLERVSAVVVVDGEDLRAVARADLSDVDLENRAPVGALGLGVGEGDRVFTINNRTVVEREHKKRDS